ncbi:MAG TPA: hypothetical protein PLP83_02295 [Candidatus Aminicenantes bacterium]|nr:hypothetical protein [Candidatus Aminicenantes bacterium]
MGKIDWKKELENHFENVKVIAQCQAETVAQFDQFCEFIAEPAFESLTEELDRRRIRSAHQKIAGRSIRFTILFPGSKDDQFHYRISLPKNSVELRLKLQIKARPSPKADYETTDGDFMPGLFPFKVLRMDKDEVVADVVKHYTGFCYKALTSPD